MMNEQAYLAQRQEKDDFFKHSHDSPLLPERRERFGGLRYYPPDPALDLVVEVQPVEANRTITIQTTTGDYRLYKRFARFTFTVDGQETALTIYETPHGYFLPFVDANADVETYPAGRYLEPERLPDSRFHVDFNLAYNPFCAYSDIYSCPITPAENRLMVAVRAGEMLPE